MFSFSGSLVSNTSLGSLFSAILAFGSSFNCGLFSSSPKGVSSLDFFEGFSFKLY